MFEGKKRQKQRVYIRIYRDESHLCVAQKLLEAVEVNELGGVKQKEKGRDPLSAPLAALSQRERHAAFPFDGERLQERVGRQLRRVGCSAKSLKFISSGSLRSGAVMHGDLLTFSLIGRSMFAFRARRIY